MRDARVFLSDERDFEGRWPGRMHSAENPPGVMTPQIDKIGKQAKALSLLTCEGEKLINEEPYTQVLIYPLKNIFPLSSIIILVSLDWGSLLIFSLSPRSSVNPPSTPRSLLQH